MSSVGSTLGVGAGADGSGIRVPQPASTIVNTSTATAMGRHGRHVRQVGLQRMRFSWTSVITVSVGELVPHTGIAAILRRVPAECGCSSGLRPAPVGPARVEGTNEGTRSVP